MGIWLSSFESGMPEQGSYVTLRTLSCEATLRAVKEDNYQTANNIAAPKVFAEKKESANVVMILSL